MNWQHMLFPSSQTILPYLFSWSYFKIFLKFQLLGQTFLILSPPTQPTPPIIRHNGSYSFLGCILVHAITVLLYCTYLVVFLFLFLDWETLDGKMGVTFTLSLWHKWNVWHMVSAQGMMTMNHQSFGAMLSGHLTGLTFLSILNSLVKNLPAKCRR